MRGMSTKPTPEILEVARAMYNARGDVLRWRRADGQPIPRWSVADCPEGVACCALDDGPGGEAERGAWVEAAVILSIDRPSHRRRRRQAS